MDNYSYLYTDDEQKFIDNNWNLNNQLEDYLFNNINKDYNDLELLFFIYIKLCFLAKYDSRYIIDKSKKSMYNKEE